MDLILQVASIVVALILIGLIMLQIKGGAMGSLMGGENSISHTRRGLEKTIFRITIVLSIAFMGISMFSVIFSGGI